MSSGEDNSADSDSDHGLSDDETIKLTMSSNAQRAEDVFHFALLGGKKKTAKPASGAHKKPTKKHQKHHKRKRTKKQRYDALKKVCKEDLQVCEHRIRHILEKGQRREWNLPPAKEDANKLLEFMEQCRSNRTRKNSTLENKKCLRELVIHADAEVLARQLHDGLLTQAWFKALLGLLAGLILLILVIICYCYCGKDSKSGDGHKSGKSHKSAKKSTKNSTKKSGKQSTKSKAGDKSSKK